MQADLFYCGPDGEARRVMEQLIADVGLRPIRVGDLDQLRLVDNLGAFWGVLVFRGGMGQYRAFKVLAD